MACSCPNGYTLVPGTSVCEKITFVDPTGNTIYRVGSSVKSPNYGILGTVFYESTQNKVLPIKAGSVATLPTPGLLFKENNGNGTALSVTNYIQANNTIWTSNSAGVNTGNKLYGRLNNISVWPYTAVTSYSASVAIGNFDPTNPNYYGVYPPAAYEAINGNYRPLKEWIGFSNCINIQRSDTYFVGFAADNLVRIKLNGTLIIELTNTGLSENFRYWHVIPIYLNAGSNIIETEVYNQASAASFGIEIYDGSINDLLSITTQPQLDVVTVFSSGQKIGPPSDNQYFDVGSGSYKCPDGYALSTCDNNKCKKIESVDSICTVDTCLPAIFNLSDTIMEVPPCDLYLDLSLWLYFGKPSVNCYNSNDPILAKISVTNPLLNDSLIQVQEYSSIGTGFDNWVELKAKLPTNGLTLNFGVNLEIYSGLTCCCNYDFFVDEIRVDCPNQRIETIVSNIKCPGFTLNKVIDNKKSWVYNPGVASVGISPYDQSERDDGSFGTLNGEGTINRTFAPSLDADIPWRYTDYLDQSGVREKHSNLVMNTKELDLTFDMCADCPISATTIGCLSGYTLSGNTCYDGSNNIVTSAITYTTTVSYLSLFELENYKKQFQSFWIPFMEQFIPATTIWVAGERWCNEPCVEIDPCDYDFELMSSETTIEVVTDKRLDFSLLLLPTTNIPTPETSSTNLGVQPIASNPNLNNIPTITLIKDPGLTKITPLT